MNADEYVRLIKKLREETGMGLMECRKAIDIHPGDYESAVEHMRCMGQAVVRRPGAILACGCRYQGG